MMAVHELGHIMGAIITGGTIERVVLHPLTISRTDVYPNPHPVIVVWLGPVIGCILPLTSFAFVPKNFTVVRNGAQFFAGFCLIANGAYICIGSFGRLGDCGEMLRTGTPLWAMIAFGALTLPLGRYLWHGLGSIQRIIKDPPVITQPMAYVVFGALLVAVILGFALSPR